ncbi:MAG: SoxR reducing system RseC family protein [Flavobacteriaceae bacterium]|nr:SoxR reducing system RseC family protein [Flavobacteriaceae bacterium]
MQKFDLNSEIKSNRNLIKHRGIISKITNGVVTVSLLGNVHCEACNAKSSCGISESDVKEIEVYDASQLYELNETVELVLQKDLGLKAVFWAYLVPFIVMISTLIITSIFFKEWIAGLVSLLILIPYYLILHILKNSFKKVYNFSILKYHQA